MPWDVQLAVGTYIALRVSIAGPRETRPETDVDVARRYIYGTRWQLAGCEKTEV